MTHGSEWDMEIWRPEVENVTLGRVPLTTACVSCVLSYDKKQTKRKQKRRRIYLTFAFSERHVTLPGVTLHCHPGDIITSPRLTVKRWTYDNVQRHVTAFRPISETAHGWSYSKLNYDTWALATPGGPHLPAPGVAHVSAQPELSVGPICSTQPNPPNDWPSPT